MTDTTKGQPSGDQEKVPFWKKSSFKSIAVLIVVIYFICTLFYPTYTWYEKITVTVATPEGDKSGYSIRKINHNFSPSILSNASGVVRSQRGEAVVVELGENKYLFALLGGGGGHAGSVYRKVFPDERAGQSSIKWYEHSLRGRGAIEIPRPSYPRLVHFEDINEPVSIKKVNPERFSDSFGSGYQLKSITLEMVNQPVTYGRVEETLSWINSLNGKMLDGNRISKSSAKNKLANKLNLYAFIKD